MLEQVLLLCVNHQHFVHNVAGHSLFKIPVQIDEDSTCKMKASYKQWLCTIECFIWDEISMCHRWAIDAVDRLLQDIRQCRAPFGGCTMVFCGDMQQLLPVHRFAKDSAAYCVKTCTWYSTVQPLHLTHNVRAITDPAWASFVANVGSGRPAVFPDGCIVADVAGLIAAVWPDGDFLQPGLRSILTMTRADAAAINNTIMAKFPGVMDMALSLDAALDCEGNQFPLEYVYTMSISGVPDHVLLLKPGAPYMILHNASPALCNGTRVIYHRRVGKCLEVEIASGEHKGQFHYIPRFTTSVRDARMPFTLRRIQFPMMPCFAMTVHKSQGQTLDTVGVYFSRPTWAHGLLYVAISRARRQRDCFFVGILGASVHNFTSRFVLQQLQQQP